MKQRCLLALDLDGTACNDAGHLGQRTKEAFTAAHAQGHIICFATGRRDIDMVSLGDDYRQADYLLLNNGGKLVRTADNAVLFNLCIDQETIRRIVTYCLEKDYILHVLSGRSWKVNRWTPGLQNYVDALGAAPELYQSLDEVCCTGVEGLMATDEMDQICRFIDAEQLPLAYVRSEATCMDIMCPGVSKWSGLSKLLKLLDIPVRRLIAAGDYCNDLEMITNAGIGVAVRNALPCVKQVADYVTTQDNNQDAAAEIVERFLLDAPLRPFVE